MRKSIRVLAVVLSAVVSLFGLSLAAAVADSPSLCVNPHGNGCYQSIQDAVDHASPGARINVAAGTYAEQVTITKIVVLHGAGGHSVVDATGQDRGIFVNGASASGTVVSGFTVENSQHEGILIQDASGVTIDHNTVLNNDRAWLPSGPPPFFVSCPGANPFDQDDCGEAVHLLGATYSTVAQNHVEGNRGGILLTDETGANHDNLITNNTVIKNTSDCGITLPSHPANFSFDQPGYGVYHNTVSYNFVSGNGSAGVGIFAPTPGTSAYENLIIGNTLTNNGIPGVALHSHAPDQNLNGNQIIGNVISGNGPDEDPGVTDPTGILIFSDAASGAAPIQNTTIRGNTVSGESIDVWVGTSDTSLELHQNNLLGSGMVGVQNASGTGTVDASNNYWGCSGGPGAPGCSTVVGAVDFTPWLTHHVPASATH